MKNELSREIVVALDPKSIYSEAYRVLRTNLQFTGLDKPLKAILITSSNPQEGKTTVVANLAVAMAQVGNKVLLVDADMRKPRLQKVFVLENYKGLSTMIASDDNIDSVVNHTEISNLDILTSGPVPPNPAEILSSKKMKLFIERCKENYDITLFDTPPVNSVADASILSTMVDGTIIVTAANQTEREAVKVAKVQLEKVNANILGIILNKVKESTGGYYYYYYYGEDNQKIRKKKRHSHS